jgi:4-hydroxythreonine-4-phosphate dehydrogenase
MQQKVRVGITIGDINGIGPEVIIKTLYNPSVQDHCIPVIYGSSKVVSYHKNVVKLNDFIFSSIQSAERLNYRKVNVLNCWEDTVNITLGKATTEGGQYAYIALDRAVRDLKEGLIDVLVTGPVNKHAMQMVNFPATGHTEYLEKELGGDSLMIMVSEEFRVALATGHIPISEVAENITHENVKNALSLFIDTLRVDFGIEKPKIALLGLNPHASDEGLMGDEEEEILRPLVVEFKNAGHLVMGPYSSDGFFGSGLYRKFDGILAMYHDQGLIPFKALSFGQGVNYTAGLPYIRTSPDHGTAYDLVGTNSADEQSFRKALYLAIDTYRERSEYEDLEENSIKGRRYSPETQAKSTPRAEDNVAAETIEEDSARSSDIVDRTVEEDPPSVSNTQNEVAQGDSGEPPSDVVEEVAEPDSEPQLADVPDIKTREEPQSSTVVQDAGANEVATESAVPENIEGEEVKKEPKSSEDVESNS